MTFLCASVGPGEENYGFIFSCSFQTRIWANIFPNNFPEQNSATSLPSFLKHGAYQGFHKIQSLLKLGLNKSVVRPWNQGINETTFTSGRRLKFGLQISPKTDLFGLKFDALGGSRQKNNWKTSP